MKLDLSGKIHISLPNTTYSPNITTSFKSVILRYPCPTSYDCFPYEITYNPGIYHIEAYDPSGGTNNGQVSTIHLTISTACDSQYNVILYHGNTECYLERSSSQNQPDAGDYISCILHISQKTLFFTHIGGKDEFSKTQAPY
jgi:hypothetical protein